MFPPFWDAMQRVLSCNFDNLHLITDSQRTRKLAHLYRQNIVVHVDPELRSKVPSELIYEYVRHHSPILFANHSLALSTFVSKPFSGALADNITFIDKNKL